MKPSRAIAVLSVPFAALSLVLLGGMCLTSYWDCRLDLTFDIWKPALFVLAVFTVAAALVLYVDLLLIKSLPNKGASHRIVLIGIVGAAVATLPRILLALFGGQGLSALSPQVEFVPFVIAGAIFAVALDRLVRMDQT